MISNSAPTTQPINTPDPQSKHTPSSNIFIAGLKALVNVCCNFFYNIFLKFHNIFYSTQPKPNRQEPPSPEEAIQTPTYATPILLFNEQDNTQLRHNLEKLSNAQTDQNFIDCRQFMFTLLHEQSVAFVRLAMDKLVLSVPETFKNSSRRPDPDLGLKMSFSRKHCSFIKNQAFVSLETIAIDVIENYNNDPNFQNMARDIFSTIWFLKQADVMHIAHSAMKSLHKEIYMFKERIAETKQMIDVHELSSRFELGNDPNADILYLYSIVFQTHRSVLAKEEERSRRHNLIHKAQRSLRENPQAQIPKTHRDVAKIDAILCSDFHHIHIIHEKEPQESLLMHNALSLFHATIYTPQDRIHNKSLKHELKILYKSMPQSPRSSPQETLAAITAIYQQYTTEFVHFLQRFRTPPLHYPENIHPRIIEATKPWWPLNDINILDLK